MEADRRAGAHGRAARLSQVPDASQKYRPTEPELLILPAQPGAWMLKRKMSIYKGLCDFKKLEKPALDAACEPGLHAYLPF